VATLIVKEMKTQKLFLPIRVESITTNKKPQKTCCKFNQSVHFREKFQVSINSSIKFLISKVSVNIFEDDFNEKFEQSES
jgi:hypothetical protein